MVTLSKVKLKNGCNNYDDDQVIDYYAKTQEEKTRDIFR